MKLALILVGNFLEELKNGRFESERLLFRGIGADDADNLVRWRSREDVYRYSRSPAPVTPGEHASWFLSYASRINEIRFVITAKTTGKDIGMVGGVYEDGVFAISYYVGEPEYRGRGLAGEAILAMIDCLRAGLPTAKVCAYVHEDNKNSIACINKIGFTLIKGETLEKLGKYEYCPDTLRTEKPNAKK